MESHHPLHDPIAIALAEDIGDGDVTAEFFVEPERHASARIIAKEPAIVAGSATAAEVFRRVDTSLDVRVVRQDGASVLPRDPVIELAGSARSILSAERVALNFLQRLSGVATLTRRFVDAVAHTGGKILDTRKTTPGLRALEKAAVAAGGGTNHRFGLFDMAMVKDNHIAAAQDPAAMRAATVRFKTANPALRLELEADTLDQVRLFLGWPGVDVILLDNMTLEELREAVQLAAGRVQLEASGGVNLDTVTRIAETGVDFISVGALTHSARSMDFSLEIDSA